MVSCWLKAQNQHLIKISNGNEIYPNWKAYTTIYNSQSVGIERAKVIKLYLNKIRQSAINQFANREAGGMERLSLPAFNLNKPMQYMRNNSAHKSQKKEVQTVSAEINY